MKMSLLRITCFFSPLCLFLISCQPDQTDCGYSSEPPYLFAIGEDLSGTFEGYTPLTLDDLRTICEAVAASKRGGRVAFITIGKPTPNTYDAVCDLQPVPAPRPGLPVGATASCNAQAKVVIQKNRQVIENFIHQCEPFLKDTQQGYTDINGFFKKASVIMRDPGVNGYEKWLYANTDGKQATQHDGNKLDCNLCPQVDFYVSGWPIVKTCSAKGEFPSPAMFATFIRNTLVK